MIASRRRLCFGSSSVAGMLYGWENMQAASNVTSRASLRARASAQTWIVLVGHPRGSRAALSRRPLGRTLLAGTGSRNVAPFGRVPAACENVGDSDTCWECGKTRVGADVPPQANRLGDPAVVQPRVPRRPRHARRPLSGERPRWTPNWQPLGRSSLRPNSGLGTTRRLWWPRHRRAFRLHRHRPKPRNPSARD